MGRKVNPIGFRLGVIRDWQSKWYEEDGYSDNVYEDYKVRKAIMTKLADANISRIEIERNATKVSVLIHTSRPGMVIGRSGARVEEITKMLEKLIGKKVQVDAFEIRQPDLDAYLVARSVADQIERRVAYRRAMKQAIFKTIQAGAKGMRIICSGRLGGAEIARTQMMHQGRVPLHTIRADIDYGFAEAATTMGKIGIKVWIYRGDILPEAKTVEPFEILATSESAAPAEEKPAALAEDKKPARRKAAAKAEDATAEAKPKTRRKTAVAKDAEGADASTEAKPAKATKKAAPKAKAEKAEGATEEVKPKRATKKKEAEA